MTIRRPCQFCGLREAWSARSWCRVCETHVTCEQCGGAHLAPPELQICERCRRLNAIELREFFAAVTTIARTELDELGGRVVFPFRVPLTNVDAARLARAARELQEAARELELAELRRSNRKGPKRVDTTQGREAMGKLKGGK